MGGRSEVGREEVGGFPGSTTASPVSGKKGRRAGDRIET
jgi:hypothetical protein